MGGQPCLSYAVPSSGGKRTAPLAQRGWYGRLREQFFNSIPNAIGTVLLLSVIIVVVPLVVRWAIIDAVWYAPDAAACRGSDGACWAVIAEKYRVILFGLYPYDQQWRPAIVLVLIAGMALASVVGHVPARVRLSGWLAVIVASLVLMLGGVFGLIPTRTDEWGGLPLTVMIFVGTVSCGLPLAILLALGRRSRYPIISTLCVGAIEVTRGIPLLVVLFVALVLFPLFIPERLTVDKLLRAEIGMIVFFAAYAAEIIRGGLQAIPWGQDEAAQALGLHYWQRIWKIMLPQAMSAVVPPLTGDMIRTFKNTSLLSILGFLDILGATRAALQDALWMRYTTEAYLFIYVIYLACCFAISGFGRAVERRGAMRRLAISAESA